MPFGKIVTFTRDDEEGFSDKGHTIDPEDKFLDKVLSHSKHYVRPSEEVLNPLPMVSHLGPHLKELLPFVKPGKVFSADDIPKHELPHLTEIVHGFKRILNYPFEVTPVIEKQHDISKAVVAPLVSFINTELPKLGDCPHILILGAGPGKDIPRLMHASFHGKITAVEPDKEHCVTLRTIPGVKVFEGTFSDVRLKLIHQKFDMVIANMSIHYILGVRSGAQLPPFLQETLTDAGVFYGSYFDVETIKSVYLSKSQHFGKSILYLGDDPAARMYGEIASRSVARVSVSGRVFSDPVVEISDVYALFESVPYIDMNVYEGNDLVKGVGERGSLYPVPPGFKNAILRPELGLLRCVVARKVNSFKPASMGYAPLPSIMKEKDVDGVVLAMSSVSPNKGKIAISRDLLYLDANTNWLGEKHDGIPGKLYSRQGNISILSEDGKAFTLKGVPRTNNLTYILQVEIMKDGKIIVLDVILPPWGQTGPFISRWRWLEKVMELYQIPVYVQKWVSMDDVEGVLKLVMDAKEGVVMQSLLAPPGMITGRAGSARYVKRVRTVDVLTENGVVEYDLLGKKVRSRSDKTSGNTAAQKRRIDSAVSYEDFLAYIFMRYIGVLDGDWAKLKADMENVVPPSKWSTDQLLLFHTNRNEFIVRYLVNKTSTEFC